MASGLPKRHAPDQRGAGAEPGVAVFPDCALRDTSRPLSPTAYWIFLCQGPRGPVVAACSPTSPQAPAKSFHGWS